MREQGCRKGTGHHLLLLRVKNSFSFVVPLEIHGKLYLAHLFPKALDHTTGERWFCLNQSSTNYTSNRIQVLHIYHVTEVH